MVKEFSRNLNRLIYFIQIPSKRLKKDTGAQVNNSTFIFIADKVFRVPCALAFLFNF